MEKPAQPISKSDLSSYFNCYPFINNNIDWNKSVLLINRSKSNMQIDTVLISLFKANIELDGITSIGNIQYKFVVLLPFDSESPVQKLVKLDSVKIGGKFTYVYRPSQITDVYISFIPANICDADIAAVFGNYGNIQRIVQIKIEHPLLKKPIPTDRRRLEILLKPSTQLTDLPYIIVIGGFRCPVFVKMLPLQPTEPQKEILH